MAETRTIPVEQLRTWSENIALSSIGLVQHTVVTKEIDLVIKGQPEPQVKR